jgi:hypothetical protein
LPFGILSQRLLRQADSSPAQNIGQANTLRCRHDGGPVLHSALLLSIKQGQALEALQRKLIPAE